MMTFGYANSFWAAHGLMCQPEELCQSTEDTMRAYLVTIEPTTNMAAFLETCTEYAQRMHTLGSQGKGGRQNVVHQFTLNTWIVCGNISVDELWAILKEWPTVSVLIIQLAQSPDRQGLLAERHWEWMEKVLDNEHDTQPQTDPVQPQDTLAKQQVIQQLQSTVSALQHELDRKSAECATWQSRAKPSAPILTTAQASELSQATLAGLGPTHTCAYCGAVFPEAETACPRCGISAS